MTDDLPAHTIHMAVPGSLDSAALFYALVDGKPLGQLSHSARAADMMVVLSTSSGRDIPRASYAVDMGTHATMDGQEFQCWQVSIDGAPMVMGLLRGETIARLGIDWKDIAGQIASMSATTPSEENLGRWRPEHAAAYRLESERSAHRTEVFAKPEFQAALNLACGKFRKAGYRPVMRDARGKGLEFGYFVRPWLADGEDWPHVEGEPLQAVLQLDVKSLPDRARHLLGDEGVLQFFYAPEHWDFDHDQQGVLLRRVFPDRESGTPRDFPEEVRSIMSIWDWKPKRLVGWNEIDDINDQRPALRSAIDKLATSEGLQAYELRDRMPTPSSEDKLLGVPVFEQETRWPRILRRKMALLWQIGASNDNAPMLFAESGMGHVFVDPRDPDHMIFKWSCS